MEIIISLVVLVLLELILGIDNLIFVSIIISRTHNNIKERLRKCWVVCGLIIRSILLAGLSWLLSQKGHTIMTIFGNNLDLASMVMISGGIFLIWKTVKEIHEKFEKDEHHNKKTHALNFKQAVTQIVLIDTIFSFDSVITAGGTAKVLWVMITAVSIAMVAMFFFSEYIATFIQKHPTIKILALSFLVMIGFTLVVEGWNAHDAEHLHLKNYVYFSMGFALIVEMINLKLSRK
jgi:predicted tellurium resistance membrane protein TerC